MYHFIINPDASSGKGLHIWEKVEATLKRENVKYEAHVMESANATTEFIKKLTTAEGEEDYHVVVLGGDGTLNAVLNGIVSFEHIILSCIRMGSGNDFARNMRICKNVEKALDGILHHKEEIMLDYGEIEYDTKVRRRFLISSGIGYDADICVEVGKSRLKGNLNRLRLGKLVYVAIGLRQIFSRKATDAVISMDNGKEIEVPGMFFTVGMIHRMEGGGVPFCPHANPTDGLLDICTVKDMPKWKLFLAVVMVYLKKHFLFKNVTEYRTKKLYVKTKEPQWFHTDGDVSVQIKEAILECKQGLRFKM